MRITKDLFSSKSEYESRLKITPEKTTTTITVYDATGSIISSRTIEKETTKGRFSEAAYKEAAENRRFEIQMYWHRAAYFWAFIVSIYTAFFFISANANGGKDDANIPHSHLIRLGLAFLGFLFCAGFYLVNVGSKQWIKNLEYHEGLLEDEFAGKLYKTYFYDTEKSFSVSKINEWLCLALIFASGAFFVLQLVDCIQKWFAPCPALCFALFAASIAFLAIFLRFAKSRLMGNNEAKQELNFKRAEYE